MNLQINKKYRFIKVPYNIEIQEKQTVKDKERWVNIGYYGSLESACKGLLANVAWCNDFTKVEDILNTIKECKNEIIVAVKEFEETYIKTNKE